MDMHEQVFNLLEFERMSCRCASCGTELMFVVEQFRYHSDACPNCGAKSLGLEEIFESYRKLHQRVKDAKLDFQLRTAPTKI